MERYDRAVTLDPPRARRAGVLAMIGGLTAVFAGCLALSGPDDAAPAAATQGGEATSEVERRAEEPHDPPVEEGSDGGAPMADAGAPDAGPPSLLALAPAAPIACPAAAIDVPRAPACASGAEYPRCRWGMPSPPRDDAWFRIWRNTTPDHRWGRPGLVSLVLAAAAEYGRRWPGERVHVGDLDAPGPRHVTHRLGQDVDLYLPDAMIVRNAGGGRYVEQYEGRPEDEVRAMRARVLDFARILATCAGGEVRIYYNDPVVLEAFLAWFEAEGLSSSVGAPMEEHNDLHRFHFHLTVPLDLAPL